MALLPQSYNDLISNYTGSKKYVDDVNGLDSNDGNTSGTAYKTLTYCNAQLSSNSAAFMIIIEPGTYDMGSGYVGNTMSNTLLYDYGYERVYVAAPDGQVVIQYIANLAQRDAPIVQFGNSNTAVYGAVLKRNNNGRSTNYTVSFFRGHPGTSYINFNGLYNCVIEETNSNQLWSLQYDNDNNANAAINNCTFVVANAGQADYSGGAGFVLNNSAFKTSAGSGAATKNNVVSNQTVDSVTYALSANNTTHGVYSGTYAWGQDATSAIFKVSGAAVSAANEGDTVTVHISSATNATGTVNYTLSGISSADINDASLTGSVSLTNYEASFDIVITNDLSTGEGVETLTVSFVIAGITYTTDLTINDSSVVFQQVVASGGEYNYTSSGHALHVFKTSGTFTVTGGGILEYLVIAGGGGGGSDMGGGGGAGGYLAGSMTLAAGTYNIIVGAGGSGAPAGTGQVRGYNGIDTVAIGLTAFGGGGGASTHNNASAPAGNGGSGGGGSGGRMSSSSNGGLNGTGTAGQGNDGASSGLTWYPGGGGGAGAAAVQTSTIIGHGGTGIENSILGTSYYWAAGGAGAGYTNFGGDGGLGGGGGGAPRGGTTTTGLGGGSALNSGSDAEIGTNSAQTNKKGGSAGVNTGSGGGGGSHYNATNNGGDGGSGIVILRYTAPPPIVGFYRTGGDLRIVLNSLGGLTPGASQPNGTVVPYTISGNYINENIIGQPLTGNFVLTDNTDEITINVGTIPNTTLVFTTFGETASSDITFPATLGGDVSYLDSTLVLVNYNTLVVQSILNGIPMQLGDTELTTYKTLLVPAVLSGIPMPLGNTEWVSNGALANYKTLTLPPPDLAEVVPYRFTTVSGGGRMNTFTIKPLGAEIIIETWY
jgi:hypothetical protein